MVRSELSKLDEFVYGKAVESFQTMLRRQPNFHDRGNLREPYLIVLAL